MLPTLRTTAIDNYKYKEDKERVGKSKLTRLRAYLMNTFSVV